MGDRHPEAQKLNSSLKHSNKFIYDVLSECGKRMFFPRAGIFAQSNEAKGKSFNATIGVAREDEGSIMFLPEINDHVSIDSEDVFPYAPVSGRTGLRKLWMKHIKSVNPSIKDDPFSLPIVTTGISHGLYIAASLFLGESDPIVVPSPYWENYDLMFGAFLDRKIETFPMFKNDSLNIEGFRQALFADNKKRVVLLNFPHNPTGYAPSIEEVNDLLRIIKDSAKKNKIVIICDDAYAGLIHDDSAMKESLFSRLCSLHCNVLAVKLDGATKEYFAFGLRVGFITFGGKGLTEETFNVLEDKVKGIIRSTVSNASMLSQSLIEDALNNDEASQEKEEKDKTLKLRFQEVAKVLKENKQYAKYFKALPFNSGYFMCIRLKDEATAEAVRKLLLKKYDTGLIRLDDVLRISFSCLAKKKIRKVFDNIFDACREVIGK